MNKSCLTGCSFLTTVLACTLTASTLAAAYQDAQAGYQVDLPAQHLQIAGPGFIYSGDSGALVPELQPQEKDFNMVVAPAPQAVNKLFTHKFTTREFNKTWTDLQLLERSHVDTQKWTPKFYAPANFLTTQGQLVPFDVLAKDTLPANYKVSSREEDGKKFIVLSLENEVPVQEDTKTAPATPGQPHLAIKIALTSEQDRLYALISAVPLEDTRKQQADELQDHSPFKEKGIKEKYAARSKARAAYYQNLENNFLKSFRVQPGSSVSSLAVQDQTLNLTMPLPEQWFYTRYHTENEKLAASTTLMMPLDTIKLISDDLDKLTDKKYQGLVQEGLATNFAGLFTSRSHKFLEGMTEVVAVTSYENKTETPYAGYLKNKHETQKFLDTFFKDLDTVNAATNKEADALKTIKQTHQLNMDTDHGVLTLASQYELDGQTKLDYESRIGFTKAKFGSISYLRKAAPAKDNNSKTAARTGGEKLYQSLRLFTK